jgi:uncharacterized protein with GYD domain
MPIFITQGRFTSDAMKGMLAKPEDRSQVISQLLEKAGAKLIAYYFTFGEHDFLVVSEGPIEAAATAAIVSGAAGRVTDLKTTVAMTSAEMKACFAKASPIAATYKVPGAN